ncbi:hypothetical protein KEM55_007833, partial [Ascosphaera atra]
MAASTQDAQRAAQLADAQMLREEASRMQVANKPVNDQIFSPINLARRPGFNATGTEHTVALNIYPIEQYPTKTVHQYD